MADKHVTLHYGVQGFLPTPSPLFVRKGDAIHFQLSLDSPPNGKMRITFHDPQFFSKPQFHTGDHAIHVTHELPAPTTYRCEFLVDNDALPNIASVGGSIEPERG